MQPPKRHNDRESGLTERQVRMVVAEYGSNAEKLSEQQKALLFHVWKATITRIPANLTSDQSAEVVRIYGIINPDDKDLNLADFQHRKALRLRIRLRELGLEEGAELRTGAQITVRMVMPTRNGHLLVRDSSKNNKIVSYNPLSLYTAEGVRVGSEIVWGGSSAV